MIIISFRKEICFPLGITSNSTCNLKLQSFSQGHRGSLNEVELEEYHVWKLHTVRKHWEE